MMIRVLFVLAFVISTAAAQAQGVFPARYGVTNVTTTDVLNVRAGPSVGFAVIGVLAHDATNVEVLGTNDAGTWARIAFPEGTGWASLGFLARQPGQENFEPLSQMPLICTGTEPFWALTFAEEGFATFSTPDTEEEAIDLSNFATSANDLSAQSFNGSASDGVVLGVIRRAMCFDGASDREYGFSVDYFPSTTGAITHLSGCCRLN